MEKRTEGMERGRKTMETRGVRTKGKDRGQERVQTNGEGERGKENEVDKENGPGSDKEVDGEGEKE